MQHSAPTVLLQRQVQAYATVKHSVESALPQQPILHTRYIQIYFIPRPRTPVDKLVGSDFFLGQLSD